MTDSVKRDITRLVCWCIFGVAVVMGPCNDVSYQRRGIPLTNGEVVYKMYDRCADSCAYGLHKDRVKCLEVCGKVTLFGESATNIVKNPEVKQMVTY